MDAQCDLKLTPHATHASWLPDMKDWEFAALVICLFFKVGYNLLNKCLATNFTWSVNIDLNKQFDVTKGMAMLLGMLLNSIY